METICAHRAPVLETALHGPAPGIDVSAIQLKLGLVTPANLKVPVDVMGRAAQTLRVQQIHTLELDRQEWIAAVLIHCGAINKLKNANVLRKEDEDFFKEVKTKQLEING